MVWHGFLAKAVPTVVTGAVGVAAYEALRKMVVKAPLRAATVSVAAWGIRLAREAERKAGGERRASSTDVRRRASRSQRARRGRSSTTGGGGFGRRS